MFGYFTELKQGKHEWQCIYHDKDLFLKARELMRKNAF